jgi:rod shape-determining protein MreC
MALSRRIGRSRLTLVLLILTSLTLLTLDFRGFGPIDTARSSVLSALAPVGHGAQDVVRPFSNLWGGAFKYDDLKKRNQALQDQLAQMRSQIAAGQVAEQSNQQLLEQANLPFIGDVPTVRAPVLSGSVANFDDTIEIGRGSSSGIKVNMPVVVGTGLVGTVIQVSGRQSVVRLITDTSSSVGVTVLGTDVGGPPGVEGVATGQGNGDRLTATVEAGAPVKVGSILITRGEPGSLYPTGLPVGTVTAVSTDPDDLQQTLTVELLADVHDLSYVSVIKWLSPSS